jgi:hypothetical protein
MRPYYHPDMCWICRNACKEGGKASTLRETLDEAWRLVSVDVPSVSVTHGIAFLPSTPRPKRRDPKKLPPPLLGLFIRRMGERMRSMVPAMRDLKPRSGGMA